MDKQLLKAIDDDESLEVIKRLIQDGANPNIKNEHGWTPLHLAVDFDEIILAQYLVSIGADINSKDYISDDYKEGEWTPLHIAAWKSSIEMVKFLLENGADYTISSHKGKTPKDLAKIVKEFEIVQLLQEYEDSPDVKEPVCD